MTLHPGWPYVDKADPWSSHSRIKIWLAQLPAGARILDVGTATGTLGRLCAGTGFVLHGLEPVAEWAELARPYYAAIFSGTLDAAPDAFLTGHDLVVCADVLEHLPQPEVALRRLLALQPDGCTFIISVPNVANIWIRLNLLLGRFDYTDRGILDRTHLRFFTRRSFTAMLESAGLRIVRLDVTPIPLNLVHPWFTRTAWGRRLHRGLASATRALPRLLGYQFIAQAIKPLDKVPGNLTGVEGRGLGAGAAPQTPTPNRERSEHDRANLQSGDRIAGLQRREDAAAHACGNTGGIRRSRHPSRRCLAG